MLKVPAHFILRVLAMNSAKSLSLLPISTSSNLVSQLILLETGIRDRSLHRNHEGTIKFTNSLTHAQKPEYISWKVESAVSWIMISNKLWVCTSISNTGQIRENQQAYPSSATPTFSQLGLECWFSNHRNRIFSNQWRDWNFRKVPPDFLYEWETSTICHTFTFQLLSTNRFGDFRSLWTIVGMLLCKQFIPFACRVTEGIIRWIC